MKHAKDEETEKRMSTFFFIFFFSFCCVAIGVKQMAAGCCYVLENERLNFLINAVTTAASSTYLRHAEQRFVHGVLRNFFPPFFVCSFSHLLGTEVVNFKLETRAMFGLRASMPLLWRKSASSGFPTWRRFRLCLHCMGGWFFVFKLHPIENQYYIDWSDIMKIQSKKYSQTHRFLPSSYDEIR